MPLPARESRRRRARCSRPSDEGFRGKRQGERSSELCIYSIYTCTRTQCTLKRELFALSPALGLADFAAFSLPRRRRRHLYERAALFLVFTSEKKAPVAARNFATSPRDLRSGDAYVYIRSFCDDDGARRRSEKFHDLSESRRRGLMSSGGTGIFPRKIN